MELKLEIVNFNQAKSLYEIGFPQDTRLIETYYYDDGAFFEGCSGDYEDEHDVKEAYVAPYLELCAKWLREKKNIIICPSSEACYNETLYAIPQILDVDGNYLGSYGTRLFNTYEEALSAGIDKAIEILKRNN